MKILHVSNYFRDIHEHVGGAEQAAYRAALLARENGCEVSVVTTVPNRLGSPEFRTHSVPICEDYLPEALRKYVEAAKWYSLQFDPLACQAFKRILAEESPDVVHFHNCQFLTLGLLDAAAKAGARTIASIYDYWFFCPTVMLVAPDNGFCSRAHGPWCIHCLPEGMRAIQKVLLMVRRKVLDRFMGMVDGFHVLSEHSRSVLAGYGIPYGKVYVAPLTLPIEYTRMPDSSEAVDPNGILFAGWLNERKGAHRLLEAMPQVLKDHPEARLTLIGGRVRFGDAYEKKMDAIIDAGGFRDRVTFAGHRHPAEVKRFLQRAAVVVIPEQYENMSPLLMIEAMVMGRPLVISRVGGVPEFIEHGVTGWLADRLSPSDFARCILNVLKNPEEAAEVAGRAREAALLKCDDRAVWTATRLMYEGASSS